MKDNDYDNFDSYDENDNFVKGFSLSDDDYGDGNFSDVTDEIGYDDEEEDRKETTVKNEPVDPMAKYSGIDLSKIDYADLDKIDNSNMFSEEDLQIFKSLVKSGSKDGIDFVIVKLTESLEGLIRKMIITHGKDIITKNPQNMEDCIQECRLAIVKHIHDYDFKHKPSTFFHPKFLEKICKYTTEYAKSSVIHYTKTPGDKMIAVRKAMSKLETESKDVTISNISVETGLTFSEVQNTLELIQMDTPVYCDSEVLNETVAANTPTPEQEFIKNETVRTLQNLMNTVTPIQRKIFMEYFGVDFERGELIMTDKMSARKLAIKYKRSENDITTLINQIKFQFQNNKEFKKFFGEKKKKKESKLRLNPNAAADATLYDDFD